ncbi:bet1-like SNARE 1-2 [Tanacetum coccineum]|uniref:Bet1-like SNARE 1-2 n=1 Tax=Tanacetum coccineum TaxID=301880 RepID=A0ABQ5G9C3_9ASTR
MDNNRGSRAALFDSLEEGASSRDIDDEHENDKSLNTLQDRVVFLKRVKLTKLGSDLPCSPVLIIGMSLAKTSSFGKKFEFFTFLQDCFGNIMLTYAGLELDNNRGSRAAALFDSLEEGASSRDIDDDKSLNTLQDRVVFLKRPKPKERKPDKNRQSLSLKSNQTYRDNNRGSRAAALFDSLEEGASSRDIDDDKSLNTLQDRVVFLKRPKPKERKPDKNRQSLSLKSNQTYRDNNRGSRAAALFDSLEEGASSRDIDDDKSLNTLQDRVVFLKRLTGDIHEEVQSHNRMLDRMGNGMDSARGVMSGTVDRFKMVLHVVFVLSKVYVETCQRNWEGCASADFAKIESMPLDLEFDETEDAKFSVIGSIGVCLTGYCIGPNQETNANNDIESDAEDISDSESLRSDYSSDNYENRDSFIDDDFDV